MSWEPLAAIITTLFAGFGIGLRLLWKWFTTQLEAKDREIRRINDLRVSEQRTSSERLASVAGSALEMTAAIAAVEERRHALNAPTPK
ncbi:MAG: hypothetical protein NUW01_16995 [Gemmatimonadaceae bacterium]|nr:hypothetical protein [Gemmatimonadaceae bacterium]